MKENFKIAVSIGSRVIGKWILMVALGTLLTIILFGVALAHTAELAGGGHGNIYAFTIGLFLTDFCAFLLIFGGPVFIFLYILIANKTTVQTAIHLLWKNKAGEYITKHVGAITKALVNEKTKAHQITNQAMLKAQLVQKIQVDPNTTKLQRRVITYGLKKIKLNDIDFQKEDLHLSDIIEHKFYNFISEAVVPSWKLFWLVVALQIGLCIASFLFF